MDNHSAVTGNKDVATKEYVDNVMPTTVFSADQTTFADISSGSLAAGSPACDVTFIAPPSGKVLVTVGANLRDQSTSTRATVQFEIRNTNSSGAVFLAASVYRGVVTFGQSTGGDYAGFSRTTGVSGLTAGNTYYARTLHGRVGSGTTVDIAGREIIVQPVW